jgi:hypothetical protein
MKKIKRESYTLLLGENSCEIFNYFGLKKMHGLNLKDCKNRKDTKYDAYIAGLANYVPKKNNIYSFGDKRFVFINLQRCSSHIETFSTVFHEMMHHSLELHNYDMNLEEEIITWAENESHIVFYFILKTLKKNQIKYGKCNDVWGFRTKTKRD